MSKLRLHGTSSGYTDIAPTAAAGNNTLTAPTGTGTLVAEDSSGNITIGEGLVHTGDTNTKIKFPAADTVTVETGGSERARIDTSGRLLIGTTTEGHSNADDLTIATAGTTGITIRSGSSNNGNIFFSDATSGAGEYQGMVYYSHTDNKLNFATLGTDRLVIDSNGNTNISGITTCTEIAPSYSQLSHRNLLLNGNMQIAQRGTSFTGVTATQSTYPVDRFLFGTSGSSAWTVAQSTAGSVLANTGFAQAVKVDCTTADASLGATDEFWLTQRLEAQNLQHLRYGNAAAKSLTLSFWTRSNKTGDFGFWMYSADGGRQYATTYTINSADTWEKKVITIPGDTSGTINNDNGPGLECRWYLGAGSSYAGTPSNAWTGTLTNRTTTMNLADSTSNEWYLTGVQLEVGTVDTPFESRSYGDELLRCKRYYHHWVDSWTAEKTLGMIWASYDSSGAHACLKLDPQMRAIPTLKVANATDAWVYIDGNSDNFDTIQANSTGRWTNQTIELYALGNLSTTLGRAAFVRVKSTPNTTYLAFDAEL